MPRCDYCGNKWGWVMTLERTFSRNAAVCPYCKENQYQTTRSKRWCTLLYLIPIFVMALLVVMNVPILAWAIICFMLFPVLTLVVPFIVKLSSEKQKDPFCDVPS
ncbi:TIGR04104 family putative zinc finger protein [Halobacillus sp. MO56]